jgi:putative oxidoreductase
VSDLDAVNLALLLLRVAVGAIMLAHGVNHIFGGGKIEGTAGWFESLGMKPGILHAWLASLTEVGVGALLLAGLFTPLAASGVVAVMVVAWITNHRANGFFIFNPGEGWEYVMLVSVCGLALGGLGAGEWSLDHELELFQSRSTGLGITMALGVGSALALLAVFWRPPPAADDAT